MTSSRPPIYFVYPYDVADPAFDFNSPPALDELAHLVNLGPANWVLQTYVALKHFGWDVFLVDRFVSGAICVAHIDDVSTWDFPFNSYLVVVRADRPPVLNADHVIVQNPYQVAGACTHFVPHWPQPGIQPRDKGRESVIRRIGYLGSRVNLARPFLADSFSGGLAKMGVEFLIRETPATWPSYFDLDAVLAVRGIHDKWLQTKPATKLYNCWRAGVVPILGREPAYEALRKSELDYVAVDNVDEAVAAIQKVNQDASLFRRIIANGDARKSEFSQAAITRQWVELFEGPVFAAYRRWSRNWFAKSPGRLLRFIGRATAEHIARKRFLDE